MAGETRSRGSIDALLQKHAAWFKNIFKIISRWWNDDDAMLTCYRPNMQQTDWLLNWINEWVTCSIL